MLDCTYRVQIPHRPGQLASVCAVVADHDAVIGEVSTISLGRQRSIREITIEVLDVEHADAIAAGLEALEGVKVLWHKDRALLRHEGGKLQVEPTEPVRTVQDMRDSVHEHVAEVVRAAAVAV